MRMCDNQCNTILSYKKKLGSSQKTSYNDVKGKKTTVNIHMIQDYKLSLSGALLTLVDFSGFEKTAQWESFLHHYAQSSITVNHYHLTCNADLASIL